MAKIDNRIYNGGYFDTPNEFQIPRLTKKYVTNLQKKIILIKNVAMRDMGAIRKLGQKMWHKSSNIIRNWGTMRIPILNNKFQLSSIFIEQCCQNHQCTVHGGYTKTWAHVSLIFQIWKYSGKKCETKHQNIESLEIWMESNQTYTFYIFLIFGLKLWIKHPKHLLSNKCSYMGTITKSGK